MTNRAMRTYGCNGFKMAIASFPAPRRWTVLCGVRP